MEDKVLLRNLDDQTSQEFEPAHAKRLLAYPRTRWAEIDPKEADKTDAAGSKKALAAAGKTAPAAPSTPE